MLHHLLLQSSQEYPAVHTGDHHKERLFPDSLTVQPLLEKQVQETSLKSSDLSVMLSRIAHRDAPSFPVNVQIQQGSPAAMVAQNPYSVAENTGSDFGGVIPASVMSRVQPRVANGTDEHNFMGYPVSDRRMTFPSNLADIHHFMPAIPSLCKPVSQQQVESITLSISPSSVIPAQNILHHISNVLNGNRIHHYQSSDGFIVDHEGVKFLIAYNLPHLNTIQMQFIAGNPIQYQALCSHLASQLKLVH